MQLSVLIELKFVIRVHIMASQKVHQKEVWLFLHILWRLRLLSNYYQVYILYSDPGHFTSTSSMQVIHWEWSLIRSVKMKDTDRNSQGGQVQLPRSLCWMELHQNVSWEEGGRKKRVWKMGCLLSYYSQRAMKEETSRF